jgi:hypothetical protein
VDIDIAMLVIVVVRLGVGLHPAPTHLSASTPVDKFRPFAMLLTAFLAGLMLCNGQQYPCEYWNEQVSVHSLFICTLLHDIKLETVVNDGWSIRPLMEYVLGEPLVCMV